jgi:ABC-type transport system substrate-binding protein
MLLNSLCNNIFSFVSSRTLGTPRPLRATPLRILQRGNILCLGMLLAGVLFHGDASRCFLCVQEVAAQDALPVYEEIPYDVVTLNDLNDNARIETKPIDFPGRRPPDPFPRSGDLRVRLIDQPGEDFLIEWRGIEKIDTFEQLILQDANEKVARGRLEESYDYFVFLYETDPGLPGLEESFDAFLFAEAESFRDQGDHPAALTRLRELHDRETELTNVDEIYGDSLDEVIREFVDREDYEAAKRLIEAGQAIWPEHPKATEWLNRFQSMAAEELNQAQTSLEAEDMPSAHWHCRRALAIWPDLSEADEMLQTVYQRYPRFLVGVDSPPSYATSCSIHDWAGRRSKRLLYRTLTEFDGPAIEGGAYASPLGELYVGSGGRRLELKFSPYMQWADVDSRYITAVDASRCLLAAATPGDSTYRPSWARLVESISAPNVDTLEIRLRQEHVLPEAFLDFAVPPRRSTSLFVSEKDEGASEEKEDSFRAIVGLPDEGGVPLNGPYLWPVLGDEGARNLEYYEFKANSRYFDVSPRRPQEIVERRFDQGGDAVVALRNREIDILDRVNPWDVSDLSRDSSIVIRQYESPLIHCLIPNRTRPLTSRRNYRRALLYGIDREGILNQLWGGQPPEGCEVVSGPFMKGVGYNNPLGYGYDRSIDPREYNPILATALGEGTRLGILKSLQQQAEAAEAARESGEEGTEEDGDQVPEPIAASEALVLAHPPHDTARMACTLIKRQLGLVGIDVKLVERSPSLLDGVPHDVDLWYVELAMWEPLVDAHRLLGPEGLTGEPSPYMTLALRHLHEAETWAEVGRAMRKIHQTAYDETTVIPLWQMVDFCAAREEVEGMGDSPVTLYQNVESWRPKMQEE